MGLLDTPIGRRGFLKGGAALGALSASVGLFGCAQGSGSNPEKKSESFAPHIVESDLSIIEEKGQWRPMLCRENCNGSCVNMGYVVDGVVVRQKTDDSPDSDGLPQQRSCPKGRSRRQELYSIERLKYPMKRKSWQPGGGENSRGELRGKDGWERITWEQALDYVADEMQRVYNEYGPTAVLANAWRYLPAGNNLLRAAGGCVTLANTESFGTYAFRPNLLGLNVVWGDHPDIQMANDRFDMRNADYIVF